MGLELGVIADDLTGGMMVASLLEREGVHCPLVTSAAALQGLDDSAEAVVVARKIRLIPAAEAADEARRAGKALLSADTKRLYYKYCATFDSTADGNIGPVGEALMEAAGAERVIFCPAFPEYSVTVFQGRMFLGSTMLGESAKQFDPVTPMCNSNLVEVLQEQSQHQVGLLSHRALAAGRDAASADLDRQGSRGARLFVVDAVDDADVTRIAELVTDWPVTTGADALPMFLARTWQSKSAKAKSTPRTLLGPAPGHEAVIAGSCAAATLRQLDHFEKRHPVYRVDLLQASKDEGLVDKIADWAATRLGDGPVAVTTSADVAGVERAQAELGREGAASLADATLGGVAQRLHQLGVRKFVVAGGETSGQVIRDLEVGQVQVSSFDELGGGYCHMEGTDPLSLVLKAGALGAENFFFMALERMRNADAAAA